MRKLATLAIIFSMSALLAFSAVAGVAQAETPASDNAAATEEPGEPKFSMAALDTEHGYFEFDAEPGDHYVMNLDIRNSGNAAGVAEVYAADAFTLVNGGFGARGLEDARTGPTEWLNFTSQAFDLDAGEQIVHTVTLDVSEDAEPGENITSLVIQNQKPTRMSTDDTAIQLNQVSRHAIPVVVNIEGATEPGLEIGEAEHHESGPNSAVWIEVSNPGNVAARPETGEFRLEDETGFEMLRRDVSMDVVYGGHDTHFAINFGERLEPGDYYVWLTLTDEEQGVSASAERLLLNVPEPSNPPESESDNDGAAGLVQPPRMPGDDGSGSWLTSIAIIAVIAMLAALIGILLGRRRRAQGPDGTTAKASTTPEAEPQANQTAQADAQQTAPRSQSTARHIKPLRQSERSE